MVNGVFAPSDSSITAIMGPTQAETTSSQLKTLSFSEVRDDRRAKALRPERSGRLACLPR
jgi:hypothetical protein